MEYIVKENKEELADIQKVLVAIIEFHHWSHTEIVKIKMILLKKELY